MSSSLERVTRAGGGEDECRDASRGGWSRKRLMSEVKKKKKRKEVMLESTRGGRGEEEDRGPGGGRGGTVHQTHTITHSLHYNRLMDALYHSKASFINIVFQGTSHKGERLIDISAKDASLPFHCGCLTIDTWPTTLLCLSQEQYRE